MTLVHAAPSMQADLRLGRWEDVLADVTCDTLICDPPYGARTHAGNQDMESRFDGRRDLSYQHWTPEDVGAFVASWALRVSGWMVTMTSHDLISAWEAAYTEAGRLAFAPVPIVAPRVRLGGDGPASSAVYLMVARPREKRFLSWGALPGWYKAAIDRDGHIGGKPVSLMRAIVCDYSEPGDLVCDPCAGFGSTLIAALDSGRRAIGAEVDLTTYTTAAERIEAAARQGRLL